MDVDRTHCRSCGAAAAPGAPAERVAFLRAAFAAMRDLSTGIVYVNHGTTGAETHLPFGGVRGTGNGHREAGHTMLDAFTEWKSIYVDFSGRVQRAQIDNA